MRDIIVSFDLETTGLEPTKDEIIEIGAVKFRGDEVLGTYRQLIKPTVSIPERVTMLTGIRNEDVTAQPSIAEVLPAFRNFLGDHPVVGHNVMFDVSFIRQAGIQISAPIIDTYELASVLMPTIPRYNLNAIVQALNLTVDGDFHSALTDSMATMLAYNALWAKLIRELPRDVVREIAEAARHLDWLGKVPFEAALQEPELTDLPVVSAAPQRLPLPLPQVDATLVTSPLPGAAEVKSAFQDGQHMLFEIPGGPGPEAALIAASIDFARETGSRVAIASYNQYTDQVQARLISEALPVAAAATGETPRTAKLLGRDSYLCPRRLGALRRRAPTSIEELRVLAKILVWGPGIGEGDRDSISLRGPAENTAWVRFSAADEQCTLQRCMEQTGGACPFARACARAEQAEIVFVDQGLLIADAASSAPILPKTEHLIVIDAHHLEDAATFALGQRQDRDAFTRLLDDIGSLKKGLLADLLRTIEPALSERQRENTHEYVRNLAASVVQMKRLNSAFFDGLVRLLQTENIDFGDFLIQTRITEKTRNKPEFNEIRAAWEALSEYVREVASALAKLADRMTALRDRLADPALPDVIASVHAAADHLMAVHNLLDGFVNKPDSNTVYWLEHGQDQRVPIIRTAPLTVGPSATRAIWSRQSAVLVGATLQAGAGFDYIRDQIAVPQGTREAVLPDETDYPNTVLLYLPTDVEEPQSKDRYQRSVENALIGLSAALEGKTLALFTSTMQMKQTSQNISARLALSGITVVDQSDGSTREALLEGFEGAGKSILFGGKAFWEELDIVPHALAAVVITKLPFAPPGDAVSTARSELYENSFSERAVPEAVIKFRQAFNRLNRPRHGQRGVVVVLDKRLISKGYGRTFLESLPRCTEYRGTLSELGAVAQSWLNGQLRPKG